MNHFFSLSFYGSGKREPLDWVVLGSGDSRAVKRWQPEIGWARSHSKTCLGLEGPLSRSLTPIMTDWWQLLAGGLGPSSGGPLHRLLGFPQGMAPHFPHRERSRREGGRRHAGYNLASEITHNHRLECSPGSKWTTPRCEPKEVRTMGGGWHFGGCVWASNPHEEAESTPSPLHSLILM